MKCVPIFKERIWGGRTLQTAFGKPLPADAKIGESWELADLPHDKTVIANGPLQGRTVADVTQEYPQQITGTSDFPSPFPLLVKLLDAQDVLSVQVHPDAETCRRMGRGEPKTECWYVIDARPGAVIYKGLKEKVTPEQFARAIENGTTAKLLAKVPVERGQCHLLPAGTAHAIGGGLLRIQPIASTTGGGSTTQAGPGRSTSTRRFRAFISTSPPTGSRSPRSDASWTASTSKSTRAIAARGPNCCWRGAGCER